MAQAVHSLEDICISEQTAWIRLKSKVRLSYQSLFDTIASIRMYEHAVLNDADDETPVLEYSPMSESL